MAWTEKRRYASAFAAAILVLVLSYSAFRWLLIFYHELKIGHRLVFTISEDLTAIALAFLTGVTAFIVVLSTIKLKKDA